MTPDEIKAMRDEELCNAIESFALDVYTPQSPTYDSYALEAARRLRERADWIPRPTVDWVGTNSPDPRDSYVTRINGHVVRISSNEESARNYAWSLEGYLGMINTGITARGIEQPEQGGEDE